MKLYDIPEVPAGEGGGGGVVAVAVTNNPFRPHCKVLVLQSRLPEARPRKLSQYA